MQQQKISLHYRIIEHNLKNFISLTQRIRKQMNELKKRKFFYWLSIFQE